MSKINIWAICVFAILTGSALIYFEDYKNNQWLSLLSNGLVFLGWFGWYMWAGRNTRLNDKQIPFKDDWVAALKQIALKFSATLVMLAIIIGNFYCASQLAHQRKHNILTNEPTQTTTAVINYIEARKAKSSTTYYAIFQYKVNGEQITHPWRENEEDEFKAGDKFEIKYSVEYPEMFLLVRKVE